MLSPFGEDPRLKETVRGLVSCNCSIALCCIVLYPASRGDGAGRSRDAQHERQPRCRRATARCGRRTAPEGVGSAGGVTRLYLGCISAVSRLQLGCSSAAFLGCVSRLGRRGGAVSPHISPHLPPSRLAGAVGPCRVLPARHGRRAAPEPAARSSRDHSRDTAEIQPRYSRGTAEVQPRYSRDIQLEPAATSRLHLGDIPAEPASCRSPRIDDVPPARLPPSRGSPASCRSSRSSSGRRTPRRKSRRSTRRSSACAARRRCLSSSRSCFRWAEPSPSHTSDTPPTHLRHTSETQPKPSETLPRHLRDTSDSLPLLLARMLQVGNALNAGTPLPPHDTSRTRRGHVEGHVLDTCLVGTPRGAAAGFTSEALGEVAERRASTVRIEVCRCFPPGAREAR